MGTALTPITDNLNNAYHNIFLPHDVAWLNNKKMLEESQPIERQLILQIIYFS